MSEQRTRERPQLENNATAAKKVKSTKLYIALETITSSRNGSVTPTLKRLAHCAMRKMIAKWGKKG